MPPVPPAPQLPHEALMEVFTYPDPNRPPVPENSFSNARRLEYLGSKIAETVYLNVMGELFPRASTAQLQASVFPSLLPDMLTTGFRRFMERAAHAYQWRQQVNGPYPPNVNPHSAEEAHRVFLTYTGAVFVHYNSFPLVKEWFSDLKTAGM